MEKSKKEKAVEYFSRNFHCSQAILATYAEECGLSEDLALRLGGCFGSGMRKGEVCGACTGALMVLGALYGQCDETDLESRELCNKVNEEMMERFAEKNGSYICNEILGCDISTDEGRAYARANNLFKDLCPKMVEAAAEILEDMIKMYG